jgi:hypothetical protein
MKRWILTCFTMLLLVASPAGAKPAGNEGPGNSGAAKQCKKGGWETRARAEDFDTAFVSEEECVSYGAQGGKIVDYVAPVALTPCEEAAWAVGFDPELFTNIEVGTGGYDTFTNTAGADLFCASDGGSTILSLDEGDLYIGGGSFDSVDEMNGGLFIGAVATILSRACTAAPSLAGVATIASPYRPAATSTATMATIPSHSGMVAPTPPLNW